MEIVMLFGIVISASVILVVALAASMFQSFSEGNVSVEDELKREKILDCLPGENCGACGYGNCASLALAIACGNAPVNACPAGGSTAAQAISVIIGVEGENETRYRAQVMCSGDNCNAKIKYVYESGAEDCLAAMKLGGGNKSCKFSCIGLGSCAAVCPFEAITVANGIARIDHTKCKGCGKCVKACPKHLISLVPYDTYYWVGCMSRDSGQRTENNCGVGCTGCNKCVSVCPENAVTVERNLAKIDIMKCSGCGMCYATCPRGIIWKTEAYGADGLSFCRGRNSERL